MAKDFKVLIASIITYFVGGAFIIFFMIYFKMEEISYKASNFVLIIVSILELGYIATRLALNKNYTLKQFIVGLYSSLAIYGVILYYLDKYLGNYDNLIVMYWLLFFFGSIVIIVVCLLLNKFIKPKKKSLNEYINK